MQHRRAHVGYVEDVDEDAESSIVGIESTRKYAISEAPRSPERANTGKSRGDRRMRHRDSDDESVSSSSLTDSDSTPRSGKKGKARGKEPRRPLHKEQERERLRERERERERNRDLLDREQRERERRRREKKHREEEEHRKARADAVKDKERDSRTLKKTRPSGPKHLASQPIVQQNAYRRGHVDDPAAYGVQQPAASGSRPRAQTRPASYYAGQPSRPPMSNMGWAGPPPPAPFSVGSFPPPPHMFPGPGPGMHHAPPPPSSMGGPPPMFFDGPMGPPHPGDHLRHRFDKRPSSAMGFHSPPSAISYLPEEYDDEPSQQVARRPSRAKKLDEDRKKMPPPGFIPKRTQSARPTTAPFKPPPAPRERERERERPPPGPKPPASHRRSVGFADEQGFDDSDFQGEEELFHEVSPDQRRTALTRARRNSVAYDQSRALEIVPANGRGRRGSMYGSSAIESGGASLEDEKYLDALRYQDDVSGGAPVPLTAESLRKVSKRGEVASSRSTRSSASRDESEYKQRSNTTGITRSSSGNNEDFTIKVSGSAVVRVSGAEIECNDGGEITFSSGRGGQGVSRAGSDRESTVYQLEDARSTRIERKALTHRPRASSQSDSQSRGYAPSHAPYEHEQYQEIPYEHAPYDPALAASNFY